MTLKIFAELIELKAKAASVFPFILGIAYSWFHYQRLHLIYLFIFFIAMLLFNMAVDMLDNYMDYHHATDKHDYKEKTNIIGREQLSLKQVKTWIISLVTVSSLMGIWLASQTSWVILVLGIISYSVGIFYSAGPKPLSSLPVGEVASGITMGYIIPLICIYINSYEVQPFNLSFLGKVFLMTLPAIFYIANLMLANNTCDLEEDVLNNRHTLVYYIGKENALKLFTFLAFSPFVVIILAVYLGIVPSLTLLTILVLPKVYQNTNRYLKVQDKRVTFPLAINNLAIVMIIYSLSFLIGSFIV